MKNLTFILSVYRRENDEQQEEISILETGTANHLDV